MKELPLSTLLGALEQRAPRPLSIEEIAREAGLARYDRKELKAALEKQVETGILRRIGKTRYQWVRPELRPKPKAPALKPQPRVPIARGRYTKARAGYGFVEVLQGPSGKDILIPAGQEAEALHGDIVEVEITREDRKTGRLAGRVRKVLERKHKEIVGTISSEQGKWLLLPEIEALPPLLLTGGKIPARADIGLVARAKILDARPGEPSRGELIEVLGEATHPDVQLLTIAYEHGLRLDFPEEVLAEAKQFPADPVEADFRGREDLRHLPFVTIDGDSARDFDDAVCLEEEGRGYRLRVAIADVSHYVREGNPIDQEAVLRGTSVYFPHRAIHMLPEALSAGLCSLKPHCPRLVQVADMNLGRDGQIESVQVYRGVIESKARLTYTKTAGMISEADTPEIRSWREEYAPLLPMLKKMHELLHVLLRRRLARGSLDLDLPEALVDLSEEGETIGVRLSQRNDAHRMVEEFMLAANQAVAGFLEDRDVPLPYRIHEPPDLAKIETLNHFLEPFGLSVRHGGEVKPADLQALLTDIRGHALSPILSRVVLRSLKQAQYSIHNRGHFGLAFTEYCHFTSPIRRYPDLLVHRQVGRVLDGRIEEARRQEENLDRLCLENSLSERTAMEAERAMADLKKAEFMLGHLMEEESGSIVGIAPFGFFVALDPYPVEGLVHTEHLGTGRWILDEKLQRLENENTGVTYGIGDRVLVECTNVSLKKRRIDFSLLKRLASALPPGTVKRTRRAPSSRRYPPKRMEGKGRGR
ncbi:MAG: ribonuclease R [Bdellovibrionota bacterium]